MFIITAAIYAAVMFIEILQQSLQTIFLILKKEKLYVLTI